MHAHKNSLHVGEEEHSVTVAPLGLRTRLETSKLTPIEVYIQKMSQIANILDEDIFLTLTI